MKSEAKSMSRKPSCGLLQIVFVAGICCIYCENAIDEAMQSIEELSDLAEAMAAVKLEMLEKEVSDFSEKLLRRKLCNRQKRGRAILARR